ncbi:cytochrome P450 [Nocardioides yefusunii]|uniref:Cytochrome P450 n=1 Tax=Nocardioides yefusunii TaxID=2500546 RepID=A0ABW1R0K5_9ACTN|nr:cytochrome P450 [Nocardioides yefusunii]
MSDLLHWATKHGVTRGVLGIAARRGNLQAQLMTLRPDRADDLRRIVAQMRDAGPVYVSPIGRVVTSHAGVKQVLSDDSFTTNRPQPPGFLGDLARRTTPPSIHPLERPSLLATNAPEHTRYRRLVTGVFTVRAVERLRQCTEAMAHDLLDELESVAARPVDLVERYCAPLPVNVIAEILGVPDEFRDDVLRFGTGAAPSLDMGITYRQHRQVEASLLAFEDWLDDHLAMLRRSPGADLMSQLVAATDDEGPLGERELKATAGLVLAAGFETTVNLLGNATHLLHDHAAQRAEVIGDGAVSGPGSWLNVVEEALRFDPPVLLTGRKATRGTEVDGSPVRAGETIATVLWAANRDPLVFENPDAFDVTRANAREHIAFSSGRHHCLGAALARMEGEVALRALHERFPDLKVLPGARRRSTRILRGYRTLPVLLRP